MPSGLIDGIELELLLYHCRRSNDDLDLTNPPVRVKGESEGTGDDETLKVIIGELREALTTHRSDKKERKRRGPSTEDAARWLVSEGGVAGAAVIAQLPKGDVFAARACVDTIKQLLSRRQPLRASRYFHLLPRHHTSSQPSTSSDSTTDQLLREIVKSLPSVTNPSTSDTYLRHKIYEGFLASEHDGGIDLLKHFQTIEQEHLTQIFVEKPLLLFQQLQPLMLQRKNSKEKVDDALDEDQEEIQEEYMERLWNGMFELVRSRGIHVLDEALGKVVFLVQEKRLDEAMLVFTAFEALSGLTVLLTWEAFDGDIGTRQKIIDQIVLTLTPSQQCVQGSLADLVTLACHQLAHRVKIAWYCCAKLLQTKVCGYANL